MAEEVAQSTQDSGQNASNTNGSGATTTPEPPDWYKNPPEWLKPPAPQTQPQQQNQGGTTVAQALMDKIEALPEQIAKFMNEANPKPPTDQQPSKSDSASEQRTPGQPEGKTRQQRFTDWWFNG